MIVSRPEMGVAANSIAFAADDKSCLRMGLEARNPVDDIHTRLAHQTRPLDIRGFVETRLQFNDNGHLLAIARRFDELLDKRGIGARPVKRLLDGEHMRIFGCLGQKIHNGLKIIVGMVQENVASPDVKEDVRFRFERNDRVRRKALVAQIRAIDLKRQGHQPHKIERPVDAVNVLFLKVEDIQQTLDGLWRTIFLDFEPDSGAALHLAQLGLDGMKKILRLLLVDVEVAVPRHPEQVSSLDAHSVKQAFDVMQDDVAEKDVVVLLFGKGHDSRQDPGHLHNSDIGVQVVSLEFDDYVQALVEELRERVSRVDRKRGEDRVNAFRKEIGKVLPLAFGYVGIGVKAKALLFELRLKLLAPAAVLIIDHPAHALADGGKRLAGRESVGTRLEGMHLLLLFESSHAHLEELVEIRADDAEKFQPFEERVRFVHRLIEDALVELQPAQFTVDEIAAVLKFHFRIVRLPSARSRGDFGIFQAFLRFLGDFPKPGARTIFSDKQLLRAVERGAAG